MNSPEPLTFEEAIDFTQSLMSQRETGEVSEAEFADAIAQIIKTENGARGFFVTYLASDSTLADHPSLDVVQALQSSPDTVAILLVKNLAMSTAQAVTHRRDNNEDMAQGSDRVRMRTTYLIEQMALPQVRNFALQLRESAATGEGEFKLFLQRWNYDAQQRDVILRAMDRIIPEVEPSPNQE